MGVVCDCASSILICVEDKSIRGLDEDVKISTNGESQGRFPGEISAQKIDFFQLQTEECLSALLEKEPEHLPAADYFKRLMSGATDISARRDAVAWIQKARAYYNFGPICAYLSVHYLDRFLSTHELPIGNAKYVFDAKTIQRMELLVLNNLKWRMQSVTPFSFIDYFLHKFNNGYAPKEPEIDRSTDFILGTMKGIVFLEFKPSEVAASIALIVLVDAGLVSMDNALHCCSFLDKEKVMQCYKALQGTNLMVQRLLPTSSVPQSPIGVLDAATMSYNSDEIINSSQENLVNNSPPSKKRKLNSTSVL